MSGQNPREIATRVLRRVGAAAHGGLFVERLLDHELAQNRLKPADRRLCQELVYGVVRWQTTLDWLIGRKASNPNQKPGLQTLLRLGLYQIFWLSRIPGHAAVNETVALARRSGFGPQSGFVNALLRSYLRQWDATKAELEALKTTQPALGYSHPDWLVQRWQARWGAERTGQLLAWNNAPPEMFARVNSLKADPGKLLEQWREEDVDYDFVRRDWFEDNLVFKLRSAPPLEQLPSFQHGCFYIQDPSTLLAVTELDPRPGETVLDLCAAPGGKLTYIAQRMQNQGRLVAHDPAPERLALLKQNCARLGVTCVHAVSPLTADSLPARAFDRILLDAPCSNTGVMRRRVEVRWRLRPEQLERLRNGQLALLGQAAGSLKPGGALVYSTCSLEPEENRQVITEFLGQQGDWRLEHERELRPFTEHVDGAYVARLRRRDAGQTESG